MVQAETHLLRESLYITSRVSGIHVWLSRFYVLTVSPQTDMMPYIQVITMCDGANERLERALKQISWDFVLI